MTVNQTVKGLSVAPTAPTAIHNGQTQQFTVTAVDQFGQSFVTTPVVTWSVVSPGVGSVSSTGLYTAPSTGTGSATVRASAGGYTGQSTIQITQPAWLGVGSVASFNSASKILTVTGATTIVGDPGSDQPLIEASTSAGVITINPATALQIHIGGLSLTGGSSAVVTSLGSARTATNHRVLVIGLAGATASPLFTIDSASKLDLTDNDLVDHGGSLTSVTGLLVSGYNVGPGYWNGSGIDSSVAASSTLTALGVSQPAVAETVDLETVSPPDVEVRYTYCGDANLDGKVDGSDYSLIDAGYTSNGSLSGWSNGDFNYDGVVDGSDYALIDNDFNDQAVPLTNPTAKVAAMTNNLNAANPARSGSAVGAAAADRQAPVVHFAATQSASIGPTVGPSARPLFRDIAVSITTVGATERTGPASARRSGIAGDPTPVSATPLFTQSRQPTNDDEPLSTSAFDSVVPVQGIFAK